MWYLGQLKLVQFYVVSLLTMWDDQVHCVFLAVLVVRWLQVTLARNLGFLPRHDTALESYRE